MKQREPAPRAVCPHCRRTYAVRKEDGRLRSHRVRQFDRFGRPQVGFCPGSGELPS